MRLAITLLLAAGVAVSALAQPLPRAAEDRDDIAVSRLLGRAVQDGAGRDIGRVEDVVIDTSEPPMTHFVVVSSGGWLDFGDRHRLLPLSQFAPGPGTGHVRLELDPGQLAAVPVIEPDEWPNFETQTFWDWAPAAGDAGELLLKRRYVRATVALGKTLRDRDGEVAGELEDFVLNLGSGTVRYAAVELAGVAHPRQRHVAVPLGSIAFPSDRRHDLLLEIL